MARELSRRIVIDPEIRSGRPVIRGTRVPVDLVLGKLGGGTEIDEIVREYGVAQDDVYAALSFAAEVIASIDFREPA